MTERRPRRQTERQCSVCGKTFTATRYDASTCSPTCRTRAARAARTGENARQSAERSITALIEQTHLSQDNADIGALRRLKRLITEAIERETYEPDQPQ